MGLGYALTEGRLVNGVPVSFAALARPAERDMPGEVILIGSNDPAGRPQKVLAKSAWCQPLAPWYPVSLRRHPPHEAAHEDSPAARATWDQILKSASLVQWNASHKYYKTSSTPSAGAARAVESIRRRRREGQILVKVSISVVRQPEGSHLLNIQRAELRGAPKKGMTTLECSTGNARIGCSLVSAVKQYPCTIVMPEGMSEERKKLDIAYGAQMVYTPGV